MMINYVIKRKSKYSKDELEQEIIAVSMNELSISQAAKKFNIPTSTPVRCTTILLKNTKDRLEERLYWLTKKGSRYVLRA